MEPTRAPWAAPAASHQNAAPTSCVLMSGTSAAGAGAAANPNEPRKRIHSPQDLQTFTSSRLCEQLLSFINELASAVHGLRCSPDRRGSAVVSAFADMLKEMQSWVHDFPPLAQPMRFGNKAFRNWHARVVERSQPLLLTILRTVPGLRNPEDLAFELSCYLRASFGDATRIDYGTGHEASFLALLFCLGSHGVLAKDDAADIVLVVFSEYMRLMRRLQREYVLEPAGSHGVWGLDDFHALPFLFGSAQLTDFEEEIPTADIAEPRILEQYAESFLYVDAIRQVLVAKKGAPFHETSPMLFDITAVPTWAKIHAGLCRMYRAEVLGKFPVIQHFLFGPSLPWPGDQDTSRSQA